MGRRANKRRKARLERQRLRQENRTARAQGRNETTQYMASQGMRRGQVVGDLVSKGLDLAGSKFGGTSADMLSAEADLARAQGGSDEKLLGLGKTKDKVNTGLLVAGAALLYMLLGKKKGRR